MKHRLPPFLAGLFLVVLTAAIVGSATALTGKMTINIDFSNIVVKLDGKTLTLTDANGAAVEPFAYNGTTYLPVRAIANALELKVDWDGANSSVLLTATPAASAYDTYMAAELMSYLLYADSLADRVYEAGLAGGESSIALEEERAAISAGLSALQGYAGDLISDELSVCAADLQRALADIKEAIAALSTMRGQAVTTTATYTKAAKAFESALSEARAEIIRLHGILEASLYTEFSRLFPDVKRAARHTGLRPKSAAAQVSVSDVRQSGQPDYDSYYAELSVLEEQREAKLEALAQQYAEVGGNSASGGSESEEIAAAMERENALRALAQQEQQVRQQYSAAIASLKSKYNIP